MRISFQQLCLPWNIWGKIRYVLQGVALAARVTRRENEEYPLVKSSDNWHREMDCNCMDVLKGSIQHVANTGELKGVLFGFLGVCEIYNCW